METTVPPVIDAPHAAARPSRRRWVPWLVAYSSSLLIAAIAVGAYGVSHYSPLGFIGGQFGAAPGASLNVRPSVPVVRRVESEESGESTNVIDMQPNSDFMVIFDLGNSGNYGVTVSDIPVDDSDHAYFRLVSVEISRPTRWPIPQDIFHTIPFHPFALAPNQTRFVVLHYHFGACEPAVGYSGISVVPMMFRIAGFTRHQRVILPHLVSVKLTGSGTGCPEQN